MDQWIYFKSAADRASFLNDLDEGFEVRAQRDDAPIGERPYGLQILRNQTVDLDSIAPVVRNLLRNAQRHDGDYDGWQTSVQRSSDGAAQGRLEAFGR
jgi:regulator of RNase E activity RraB